MHSIWAVATNTIKQALRMKIAVVFIILLAILLPVMGASMTGDGTLKGRLQTFVSYSFSLTSLLLCLLTIITSIFTVTSDIDQKQIFTVLTKPIRRFQLLLGKLLGVILLDIALLTLFATGLYIVTIYIPKSYQASDIEKAQAENEFFTARIGLMPAEVDVADEVLATYSKLKRNQRLPQDVSRNMILARLTNQKKLEKRAATVGHQLLWEFENIKLLDPDQSLFIRFKYDVSVNPPDLQINSRWDIGGDRGIGGAKIVTPVYRYDRNDVIRTFHEIEVPADAVTEDGYLAVRFSNTFLNNTIVIFPPEDGLEVLYKADTFEANFLRAVFLILFRLIFLACLGVLASSFLSFPVAILLCLVIFFTGTISGFILESFDTISGNLGALYSYIFRPVIQFLPQFDEFNPAKFLVPARLLSWLLIVKIAAKMVCFKAFILLMLAILIFSRREIAKITV